jgi:hypothetical protein
MKASLFIRGRDGRRFNPYVQALGCELCIDANGFLVLTPHSSFGFIRGAGWHHRRYAEEDAAPEDGCIFALALVIAISLIIFTGMLA